MISNFIMLINMTLYLFFPFPFLAEELLARSTQFALDFVAAARHLRCFCDFWSVKSCLPKP